MPDKGHVTQLLAAIGGDDPAAADELLPLVYEELRALARAKMAAESPGLTLQPTALVHEAYLRLVGDGEADWNSRGHFYAAAAEAMRRILVERARRYRREKHGAGQKRVPLDEAAVAAADDSLDVLALDRVLRELKDADPRMYDVTMLRHFAELSNEETARVLNVSERTVSREWSYARLWLLRAMASGGDAEGGQDA